MTDTSIRTFNNQYDRKQFEESVDNFVEFCEAHPLLVKVILKDMAEHLYDTSGEP